MCTEGTKAVRVEGREGEGRAQPMKARSDDGRGKGWRKSRPSTVCRFAFGERDEEAAAAWLARLSGVRPTRASGSPVMSLTGCWVSGEGGGGEFVKADGVATFNDRWKSLVGENRYVEQSCRGFRGSLVHCRSYRIFLFFSSFCVWLFLLIFFLFA